MTFARLGVHSDYRVHWCIDTRVHPTQDAWDTDHHRIISWTVADRIDLDRLVNFLQQSQQRTVYIMVEPPVDQETAERAAVARELRRTAQLIEPERHHRSGRQIPASLTLYTAAG